MAYPGKRFVIGIGSQRAGSTLLHEVLEQCTSVYMHPLKELHYFDTLYGIRPADVVQDFSRRQLGREIERICAADDFRFVNKRYKNYLRTNFLLYSREMRDLDYLELFRPCVASSERLGEITPEYMALPEAGVAHMAQVIGRDACIILIARNPVTRIVSSFKLLNVYNNVRLDPAEAEGRLAALIDGDSDWLRAQDRYSEYAQALEVYGRHFERVLLLRYDDFVENPERVREQLAALLDEPVDAARLAQVLGERRNALGANFEFSDDMLRRLTERYARQSAWLTERFGMSCVL